MSSDTAKTFLCKLKDMLDFLIPNYITEGKNQLVIADGTARIETADCPDERCVQMGRISRSGQSIICLPHQVVVEIQGGKEAETDAVAQ